MGFAQIPEEAHLGRNQAVVRLDPSELARTVGLLNTVLHHLTQHPTLSSKFQASPAPFKASPPPYSPLLFPVSMPLSGSTRNSGRQAPPASTVKVLTPSVAALQQRLGVVDLGSGLDVGIDSSSVLSISQALPLNRYDFPTPKTRHRSSPRSFAQPVGAHLSTAGVGGGVGHQSLHAYGLPEPAQRTEQIIGNGLEKAAEAFWLDDIDTGRGTPGQQLGLGESEKGFGAGNSGIGLIGSSKPPWQVHTRTDNSIQAEGVGKVDSGHIGLAGGRKEQISGLGVVANVPPGFWRIGHSTATHSKKESLGASQAVAQDVAGCCTPAQVSMRLARESDIGKLGIVGFDKHVVTGMALARIEKPDSYQGSAIMYTGDMQPGIESKTSGQVGKPPSCQQGEFPPSTKIQSGLVVVSSQASLWQGRCTTAAAEHNRECITGMMYVPVLEGLVGGDAHSGWLLSSSRSLLNLWDCSEPISSLEPLQVMHSQATEFVMHSMDVDSAAKLLFGYCAHPKDQGFCVSIHSLCAETFFSNKGMIRLPDGGSPEARQQGILGSSNLKVVSLQPLGGPLRTSLATTVGGNVLVYELAAANNSGAVVPPKAQWKAHSTPISCIHRSSFVCALFTGASDGSICLWDLKTKPSYPVRQYTHQKQVTHVSMLDPNTVASSGADGVVNLWDIRSSGGALLTVIPDKSAVICMAVCPSAFAVAITTRQGLYCWEPLGRHESAASTLSHLTPLPPAGPCTDMQWDSNTKQLYVAANDGSISIFGKV